MPDYPGADQPYCHEARQAFEEAEYYIKVVETVDGEVVIPAINELRYVGFHLTRLLTAQSDEERENQYHSAISHCRRAAYEALDAGLVFLLEKVKLFQEDYRLVVISDVVPEYSCILARTEEAKELLAQMRADGPDRNDDFERRLKAFNDLKNDVRVLDASREELNKKIRKERRNTIITLLGLAAAILGATAALAALL